MYAGTWQAILQAKIGERIILLAAVAAIFIIGYIMGKNLGNPIDFFLGRRGWVLVALFLFAAIPVVTMSRGALKIDAEKSKGHPTAPHGIVSLELAKDMDSAEDVINGWREWEGGDLRPIAEKDIKLDFIFILGYTALLGFAVFWVADSYTDKMPWISNLGLLIGWSVPIAGLLDIIENFAMLRMLKSGATQELAQISFWTALPKFIILLGATALYLAVFGAIASGNIFLKKTN